MRFDRYVYGSVSDPGKTYAFPGPVFIRIAVTVVQNLLYGGFKIRSICGLLFLWENMVESYTRRVGKMWAVPTADIYIPGIHGMMEHMWNFTER